ncbi:p4c precursor [NY_014 poxvirus]|uniref:p4c precursor n=1 Tax=NY_014 poxvirus TaxID=2025360 RepID=UPI000B99F674|nr:p4c precursor [NY_014 poxvirus]AST09539.1 p4c precursor [NY_014 poxvirus]
MASILDLWNRSESPIKKDNESPSIKLFNDMINELWGKNIEVNTCLSRKHRNIIRKVIRDFMASYPKMDDDMKSPMNVPMQWITEYYIKKNNYQKSMMNYNNKSLYNRYIAIKFDNIKTVGEFVLFKIFNVLSGKNNDGTPYMYDVEIKSKDNHVYERLFYACKQYLIDQIRITSKYKNKYLFVASPMYLWVNINISKMRQEIDQLRLYTYNTGLTIAGFLSYMSQTSRELTTEYKLTFTYMGEKWDFGRSISETILYGLSYTVFDDIHTHHSEYIHVYFSTRDDVPGGYKFAIYNKKGKIIIPIDEPSIEKQAYAVRMPVGNDDDKKFEHYGFRNYLLIPEDCEKIQPVISYATDTGHHLDEEIFRYDDNDEDEDDEDEDDDNNYNDFNNITPTPIPNPRPRPPFPRPPGYINRPPLIPVPKPNPNGTDAERVALNNRIINILDRNLNILGSYCCDIKSVKRLQYHIETLGQYALILTRKINIQSLLFPWPLARIHPHAIDGSIPPHDNVRPMFL